MSAALHAGYILISPLWTGNIGWFYIGATAWRVERLFTVTLRNRKSSLLVDRIDDLRESVRDALRKRPFHINAWVVLPEPLHAIWTLPVSDDDSSRWNLQVERKILSLTAYAFLILFWERYQ